MNLITLPTLKNLRFPGDTTVRLPKLQRWARDGKIPGAFKQTPDSDWIVDLDEFDVATATAKLACRKQITRENKLLQMVMDMLSTGKAPWIVSQHIVVYPRASRKRSIGKPLTASYLSRRFAAAVVAAGFPKGAYKLRDVRKKGLNDEAVMAGRPTEKGGHKTEQMKAHYVVTAIPKRARNHLKGLRR